MAPVGGVLACLKELRPALFMTTVQIMFAVVNIFYKLAIYDGMNLRVLVAYRYVFATVSLAPVAFFLERKARPPLTWMILLQAVACGVFGGVLAQNLYIAALKICTATFVTAITNLIPAITFVFAVIFRMEQLRIRKVAGQAKVMGTLMGVGGAMLLTFYKGVEINYLGSFHYNLVGNHRGGADQKVPDHVESGNRVMGSMLAVASCFSYAIWLIIQTKMAESYPCHYSSTTLMCLMSSILSVGYALCLERDLSQWKLGWNIRLLTVLYVGVLASAVGLAIVAWCIRKKGPLFVSVFNPLMLVVVGFLGSLLLDEKLHLGSVLGSVLIIAGLYAVLWGKGKEMERSVHAAGKASGAAAEPTDNNTRIAVFESIHRVSVLGGDSSSEVSLESHHVQR
ncbi:hypothetical protein H6P81_015645 [Aristolochia fimbriata]|uniref:WAT1-related protein n=1 Tax=Aristolochia fimbriata TaxID=158543 RepID=A0AAV7E636_ARIFI|nr:hypothetical protein H6P81_015645 [Aristolochia fimbriata]